MNFLQGKPVFYIFLPSTPLPDKTLAPKGEACKGGKLAKERITVMLASSSTGEKLKPLVIRKAKQPRCFKNKNIDNAES
jgi:hypothetical protein